MTTTTPSIDSKIRVFFWKEESRVSKYVEILDGFIPADELMSV